MLAKRLDDIIGGTPLFELKRIEKAHGLRARLYAKLEGMNPGGSAKDRAAKYMLDDALARGLIGEHALIVEPTSGNTGIGLAALCAARGYRAVIVMPDSMSVERVRLMRAYGAKVVLTKGALGMKGAIAEAERIAREEGGFIPGQFTNPANARAHYETTGPEIDRDLNGCVGAFVAGVGTGGTITGVGRYLKEKHPDTRIVAVEPADSPLLSGGQAGPHAIQGIGANFIPEILDRSLIDRILCAGKEDAYASARELAQTEGYLAGISSGAALFAAVQIALEPAMTGKNVVALLPDTGERYLSSDLFE